MSDPLENLGYLFLGTSQYLPYLPYLPYLTYLYLLFLTSPIIKRARKRKHHHVFADY